MKNGDFMDKAEELFVFEELFNRDENGQTGGGQGTEGDAHGAGGCLGMVLTVIALSTGFTAAFFSMLSAL